jgi:hypothetical protein
MQAGEIVPEIEGKNPLASTADKFGLKILDEKVH